MSLVVTHGASSLAFLTSIALGRFLIALQKQYEQQKADDEVDKRTAKEEMIAGEKSIATSIKAESTQNIEEVSDQIARSTLQDVIQPDGSLTVQCIGTVESIYRLCVGTPRQGLLAPHARGRILLDRLDVRAGLDAVDGLEGYSHIWIVFVFHLNTLQTSKQQGSSALSRTTTKIAPPALGGRKVGVLSTRSPHRFNPVGITLARLDGIRNIRRSDDAQGDSDKNKPVSSNNVVCLDISGLDLVDGTPVLDIKPFVGAYDAPLIDDTVRVPSWVAGGLATKRLVHISERARRELQRIVRRSELAFYGNGRKRGDLQERPEEAYENIVHCIEEVLSMDVRSVYQTKKAREGKSQADRSQRFREEVARFSEPRSTEASTRSESAIPSLPATTCTQQIDNLLVHFEVRAAVAVQRISSEGSGAEDEVFVTFVQLILDDT